MSEKIRKLTDDEFGKISLKKLEERRAFVRDVHYTIDEKENDKKSKVSGMLVKIKIHQGKDKGGWTGISSAKGFIVCDDPRHIYFFERSWPCYYEEFLNPKDVIPSGRYTLNCSEENCKRAFEQIIAENTTTTAVKIPVNEDGNMNDFFESTDGSMETIEAMKEKIEVNKVDIPIDSMKMLRLAIYNHTPKVIKILGVEPVMFTKELKRADNKIVERYNCIKKCWEIIPGKPKFPDAAIRKKILNFLMVLLEKNLTIKRK